MKGRGQPRLFILRTQRDYLMPQNSHQLTLNNGASMPYLLYLPDAYDADQQKVWPFILFLHGSGEGVMI